MNVLHAHYVPGDTGLFFWAESPDAAGLARPAPAEEIPAAVLVPLFLAGPSLEPHVVLTRRRADLRRHAGEIAFPGGRKDEQDTDLNETALREEFDRREPCSNHCSSFGPAPSPRPSPEGRG